MSSLHDQVLAKLAELRATPATTNEAALLAWAEDVAKRHTLWVDERDGRQWCTGHADLERGYPCQDFAGLAHALGIHEATP